MGCQTMRGAIVTVTLRVLELCGLTMVRSVCSGNGQIPVATGDSVAEVGRSSPQ